MLVAYVVVEVSVVAEVEVEDAVEAVIDFNFLFQNWSKLIQNVRFHQTGGGFSRGGNNARGGFGRGGGGGGGGGFRGRGAGGGGGAKRW